MLAYHHFSLVGEERRDMGRELAANDRGKEGREEESCGGDQWQGAGQGRECTGLGCLPLIHLCHGLDPAHRP